MSVLTEDQVNEFAAKMLEPKVAPGIQDAHTAYDWVKNVEMILIDDARRLREDRTPEGLIKYVESNMHGKINSLSGFNAFEMAVLALDKRGKRHPSNKTAQDVFAEKFGVSLPDKISGGLLRYSRYGAYALEDFIAEYPKMGFRPNENAKKALNSLYREPLERMPWLRPGRPHLLNDATGNSWMVVCKLPGDQDRFESMSEDPGISTQMEVAHTLIALEELGFKPDNVILVPYSMRDSEIATVRLEIGDHLKQEMIDVGNKMYNEHLVTVQMPQWEKSDNFYHMEERDLNAKAKAEMGGYTLGKAIESAGKKIAASKKKSLQNMAMDQFGIPSDLDGKKRLGTWLDIDQKIEQKVDYKAVAAWLIAEHDCSIDDFTKPIMQNDLVEAVINSKQLQDVVAERFTKKSVKQTFRIPKTSDFKNSAEEMSKEFVEEINGLFDEVHGLSQAVENEERYGSSRKLTDRELGAVVDEIDRQEEQKKAMEEDFGF